MQDGFPDDKPPRRAAVHAAAPRARCSATSDAGIAACDAQRRLRRRGAGGAARRARVRPRRQRGGDASESRWRAAATSRAGRHASGDDAATVAGVTIARTSLDDARLGDSARLHRAARALEMLARRRTARLERALAEHLDCCTYRLDAWHARARELPARAMRERCGDGEAGRGTPHAGHLPRRLRLARGRAPAGARRCTGPSSCSTTISTKTPAATAAAARARQRERRLHPRAVAQPRGHRRGAAQRLPRQRDARRSPTRSRSTCRPSACAGRSAIIEGIRNGQSLGALLGYRFERGLHDRHALAEVRPVHLSPLRQAFPLRADRLSDHGDRPARPIEAIEARNVVDGLQLRRRTSSATAQSQLSVRLSHDAAPRPTKRQRAAINAEVDRAARRPRRRRRSRARRGRAPGGAGQLRPRRRRRSTLHDRPVPARARGRPHAAQRHRR